MASLDRDAVGAASACNWCAFILLLFAACSPWWSWGYYYGNVPIPPYGYSETSIGPWIAGYVWTYIPYYYCYGCIYAVSTSYVYWSGITAQQACNTNATFSQIENWSGPNGLNLCGGTPENPTFTVPSHVSGIQACIIIAVILCFFAAVLGCVDAGSSGSSRVAAKPAACISCTAAIFSLAAFCTWSTFNYVNNLQYTAGGWWMPVYYDVSPLALTAIVTNMWWGPGFATSITAFILQFFATVVHFGALSKYGSSDDDAAPVFKPADPQPEVPPAVEPVVEAKPVQTV